MKRALIVGVVLVAAAGVGLVAAVCWLAELGDLMDRAEREVGR